MTPVGQRQLKIPPLISPRGVDLFVEYSKYGPQYSTTQLHLICLTVMLSEAKHLSRKNETLRCAQGDKL